MIIVWPGDRTLPLITELVLTRPHPAGYAPK